MFSILVVDDEQIERDSIKFLLDKYGFELNVFEAENGEEALEQLLTHSIDILFTDIKMPFMDGLELAVKARQQRPGIKIIIYSAFGEFDYAKKAIEAEVMDYILKPLEVNVFTSVLTKAIHRCEDEQKSRKKREAMENTYKQMTLKKTFLDLLYDGGRQKHEGQENLGIELEGKCLRMILFDFRERVFAAVESALEQIVSKELPLEHLFINLNEYQSLAVLVCDRNYTMNAAELYAALNQCKSSADKHYDIPVCIVIGKKLEDTDELYHEFNRMERIGEYKFFLRESLVLDESRLLSSSGLVSEYLQVTLKEIDKCALRGDIACIRTNTLMMFELLQNNMFYSAVYIKSICSEIINKIYRKKFGDHKYKQVVERIFTMGNLEQLSEIILAAIDELETDVIAAGRDTGKQIIEKVMEIIHSEYHKDIGLPYLADKVYVSPSYLSYLFKKETQQNIVKYIMAYRLEKAADLLHQSNLKIWEVCSQVGFSNLSYFCSLFKSYKGVTPIQYRRKEG
ncbi:MAG TPA: response regulator [Bacilli bacterium]